MGVVSSAGIGVEAAYAAVSEGCDLLSPLSVLDSGLKERPLCAQAPAEAVEAAHGAAPNRAHLFEASSENCLECHANVAPEGTRIADLPCRECHFAGFVGQPGQG